MPLVRIGSKRAFSDEGLAPVITHQGEIGQSDRTPWERHHLAVVRIAALFHDLGKATVMFQDKLRLSMRTNQPVADIIRHELFSAVVWDTLVGAVDDSDIVPTLIDLTPTSIDRACAVAAETLAPFPSDNAAGMTLHFLRREGSVAYIIGMLILTHHRLPSSAADFLQLNGECHVKATEDFDARALDIYRGIPFWHERWWLRHLQNDARFLLNGLATSGVDMALRSSLMMADQVGSSEKQPTHVCADHLGNTKEGLPADSLSLHVRRVYSQCRSAFDAMHRFRSGFPALSPNQMPAGIMDPGAPPPRFAWQAEAATAAAGLCAKNPGGFFGCIMSGTGTGKTRGAPTILAAATFADADPERRSFRMILGLGLRSLASQSAREYVGSLGFSGEVVAKVIGQEPLEFLDTKDADEGSESLSSTPYWLDVQSDGGGVPQPGDEAEYDWLRGLSLDTDSSLPAFARRMTLSPEGRDTSATRFLSAPVLVGTVDHVVSVASPTRSRHLHAAMRVMTSDLILDEVDQYSPEDIAVLCRLVYQAAAAGRRVMVMSATITKDIAEAFHANYVAGWAAHSADGAAAANVNVLCVSEHSGAVFTNANAKFEDVFDACRKHVVSSLDGAPSFRIGEILPACSNWQQLVEQTDQVISRMHDQNAVDIAGFRVSVGLVRMTRIKHTVAMAVGLPAGRHGRLRLKVCLHSQFPRAHREWIEYRLRGALARAGGDEGLEAMLNQTGALRRAKAAGVKDIEIVVVTSPVIETGNDLDFDYAIIDAVSTRAIIQTAGRVRRHRGPAVATNIAVLGRSPIAMSSSGRLAQPGVETTPSEETGVCAQRLDAWPDRATVDLLGAASLSAIDSRLMLKDYDSFPIRDSEARLCRDFVAVTASLAASRYIQSPTARMSARTSSARRFRRSNEATVRLSLVGEDITRAEWAIDLAPGRRGSRRVPYTALRAIPETPSALFENLHAKVVEGVNSEAGMSAFAVELADRSRSNDMPRYLYSDFTGFVQCDPDDLLNPLK